MHARITGRDRGQASCRRLVEHDPIAAGKNEEIRRSQQRLYAPSRAPTVDANAAIDAEAPRLPLQPVPLRTVANDVEHGGDLDVDECLDRNPDAPGAIQSRDAQKPRRGPRGPARAGLAIGDDGWPRDEDLLRGAPGRPHHGRLGPRAHDDGSALPPQRFVRCDVPGEREAGRFWPALRCIDAELGRMGDDDVDVGAPPVVGNARCEPPGCFVYDAIRSRPRCQDLDPVSGSDQRFGVPDHGSRRRMRKLSGIEADPHRRARVRWRAPVLHVYVHGRGRGHATRSAAVVATLQARGHDVRVFASGDALDVLDGAEPVAAIVPGPDARHEIQYRTYQATCALRADAARALITDGDLPSLLAARNVGVPSIAVGHGLAFAGCYRPAYAPGGPWYRAAVHVASCTPKPTYRVAVTFAPLRARPGTVLASPTIDPAMRRVGSDGPIVCYFRDGAPALLRQLVALGVEPVVFASEPPQVDRVRFEPTDRARFIDALGSARAVVASAGSQLISECAVLRIPLFAVYATRDDEQRLNAVMARAAGIADAAPLSGVNPAHLGAFVDNRRPPARLPAFARPVDEVVHGLTERALASP